MVSKKMFYLCSKNACNGCFCDVCLGLQIRHRRGKLRMAAEGAKMLLEACKNIVNNEGSFCIKFKLM